MSLSGKDLVFSYNGVPVVNGVSLKVEPGRLTMLIGPNGSGKSTLLKLLSGFLVPESGSVELDGRSPAAYSWRERARRLAFLSQDFYPGLEFTVRETVMLGRNPHLSAFSTPGEADEAAVDRALHDMELTALADRPVNRLSGGERQRTMLAAIFAQQAECLLLDEPTSALDVRHALTLAEYLKDLSSRCGILMVTHDLSLALRYADAALLLREGERVADGTPDEVLTPEHLRRAYGCRAEILRDGDLRSVAFYR